MNGPEHSAEKDVPTMGQWAHDVAAQYRSLAARETWEPRRTAIEQEAEKYDRIGRRMDRIATPLPPAKTEAAS